MLKVKCDSAVCCLHFALCVYDGSKTIIFRNIAISCNYWILNWLSYEITLPAVAPRSFEMRPLASKQEKCFLDCIPSRYFPPRGSDSEDWWFWSGYSQVSLEWLSPVRTAVWFYTMDGQCSSPASDTSISFHLTSFAFPVSWTNTHYLQMNVK